MLVDPLREYPHVHLPVRHWAHLTTDGAWDELHAFAARLGVPRHRFQGDHYDLPPWLHRRALELGAEPVSTAELLRRMAGPRGERARRRHARGGAARLPSDELPA